MTQAKKSTRRLASYPRLAPARSTETGSPRVVRFAATRPAKSHVPSGSVLARSRFVSLLQIGGAVGVMAFHIGVPGASWGWMCVILFFVLAGVNMAGAVDRSNSVLEYGRSRVRRLAFPVALVWLLVAGMTVNGMGSSGARWFLLTSPVFLQNLTLPFFQYSFPGDWAFGPLWFLGALLQLQLVLFAVRRLLVSTPPLVVAGGAVVLGVVFRGLASIALGGSLAAVDSRTGDILYCLPFTHIEAITLGFLIGRGELARLGRSLPIVALATIGAILLAASLSAQHAPIEALGLAFPLSTGYMHVWAYSVLAIVVASLCAPQNPLANRVNLLKAPAWLDNALLRLGALTFGAYVVHGIILAFGLNLGLWFRAHGIRPASPLVLLLTVVESFLLAWVAFNAARAIERVGWAAITPTLRSRA
jgi:hypothetical protein